MEELLRKSMVLLEKADGITILEGEGYSTYPTEEIEFFLEDCNKMYLEIKEHLEKD